MARKSPFVSQLEGVAKKLSKAKPTKAYELLHEAFLVFAAAGDAEPAGAIIRLAYGGTLPPPTVPAHALGSGPMDGLCAATDLGDLTKGQPSTEPGATAKPLAERVRSREIMVRSGLTSDAYSQLAKPKKPWTELTGRDLYRTAQMLARPGNDGALPATELDALAAMSKYMDGWCADRDDRGAGYGREIALALDLAIRHGATDRTARWLTVLGQHLLDWGIEEALCLPAVASAIASGILAPLVVVPSDQAATLHRAIADAATAASGGAATKSVSPVALKPGKPVRRTIHAEYSQFYLEHADSPRDEVFFQDDRENAQGFSLFATKVGVATPSETGDCAVELAIASGKPSDKDLAAAIQAVSFPFAVKGPLFVRSVSGGGDDEDNEVVLPNGTYDVLARFVPKPAAKADADVDLRSFKVTLDFYPAGVLAAPKCLKLEHGAAPKEVFVNA